MLKLEKSSDIAIVVVLELFTAMLLIVLVTVIGIFWCAEPIVTLTCVCEVVSAVVKLGSKLNLDASEAYDNVPFEPSSYVTFATRPAGSNVSPTV